MCHVCVMSFELVRLCALRAWQRNTRRRWHCYGNSRRWFLTMSWFSGRDVNSWPATAGLPREDWTYYSHGTHTHAKTVMSTISMCYCTKHARLHHTRTHNKCREQIFLLFLFQSMCVCPHAQVREASWNHLAESSADPEGGAPETAAAHSRPHRRAAHRTQQHHHWYHLGFSYQVCMFKKEREMLESAQQK